MYKRQPLGPRLRTRAYTRQDRCTVRSRPGSATRRGVMRNPPFAPIRSGPALGASPSQRRGPYPRRQRDIDRPTWTRPSRDRAPMGASTPRRCRAGNDIGSAMSPPPSRESGRSLGAWISALVPAQRNAMFSSCQAILPFGPRSPVTNRRSGLGKWSISIMSTNWLDLAARSVARPVCMR